MSNTNIEWERPVVEFARPDERPYLDEPVEATDCITLGKKIWRFDRTPGKESIIPLLIVEIRSSSAPSRSNKISLEVRGMYGGEWRIFYVTTDNWRIEFFPTFRSAVEAARLIDRGEN